MVLSRRGQLKLAPSTCAELNESKEVQENLQSIYMWVMHTQVWMEKARPLRDKIWSMQ